MKYTIIKDSNDIIQLELNLAASYFDECSVDLEGEDLCRDGKILSIQMYVIDSTEVIIFDCSNLSTFEIKKVLAPIFENASIAKYMFDCRSDADALYHQYNIKLAGVVDVQLYEVGFRKCKGFKTRFYHSLFTTLNEYMCETGITKKELDIKKKRSDQFKQKKYELDINDNDTLEYLSIDVIYLKKLYSIFKQKVGNGKVNYKIAIETEKRQNIWMENVFLKGRNNALSEI